MDDRGTTDSGALRCGPFTGRYGPWGVPRGCGGSVILIMSMMTQCSIVSAMFVMYPAQRVSEA